MNSELKVKLKKGAEVERKLEMQRGKTLQVLYPADRRHQSNTRQFKEIQPGATGKSPGYLARLLLSCLRFLSSLISETDLSGLFGLLLT